MNVNVVRVDDFHVVHVTDTTLVAGAGTLLADQLEAVLNVGRGELTETAVELNALLQLKGPNVSSSIHLPTLRQHWFPFAGHGVQLDQILHEGAVLVHEVNTA